MSGPFHDDRKYHADSDVVKEKPGIRDWGLGTGN